MARHVYVTGLFMVALVCLLGGGHATEYTVGGSRGWSLPPNDSADYYNVWSSNNTFYVGDQLVFNWNGSHTAADVTEDEYKNCVKDKGLILSTSGVMVNLTSNGTRYFICTIGSHCEQGQKMTVVVGDGVPDDPSDSSAPNFLTYGFSTLFLSTILVYFLLNLYV